MSRRRYRRVYPARPTEAPVTRPPVSAGQVVGWYLGGLLFWLIIIIIWIMLARAGG